MIRVKGKVFSSNIEGIGKRTLIYIEEAESSSLKGKVYILKSIEKEYQDIRKMKSLRSTLSDIALARMRQYMR